MSFFGDGGPKVSIVTLTGYSRAEALGKSAFELGLWVDDDAYVRGREQLKEKGVIDNQEVQLRLKSGEVRTFLISAEVVTLGGERRILNAAVDISERKAAEAARAESDLGYRTLFNATDEGFCVIEMLFDAESKPLDYRFLETNPQFENHTGLAALS